MRPSHASHCITIVTALVATTLAVTTRADDKRDEIGEVLGKPVYRDELKKDNPLADELHRLFAQPVLEKYRKEHEKEIAPTEAELAVAQKFFDDNHFNLVKDKLDTLNAEMKEVETKLKDEKLPKEERLELEVRKTILEAEIGPPGRQFAEFMLNNWKFQRHLYDRFGGGRAIWQQAGVEAFDAMRKWLETHEKQGAFKISDPALRRKFYHYWTTQNHGPFVIKGEERLRTEFLEVEWAPRQVMK